MASSTKKTRLQVERLETRDCPTAGALDTAFGSTGIVAVDFGIRGDGGSAVVMQLDGKIVVAGHSQQPAPPKKNQPQTQTEFALARLNVDGTLDTSFGIGGQVLTDFGNTNPDVAYGVAIQPDGKIVVAGVSDSKFAVARYNSNGTLDTSFDGDGLVVTSVSGSTGNSLKSQGIIAMVLQSDGKILVGGNWRPSSGGGGFALVRYNANGSLDTSFDGDGISGSVFTNNAAATLFSLALELESDGLSVHRIVAAGELDGMAVLARYNANGSLDTSFGGGDGHVELTDGRRWQGVTVQSDHIIVTGSTTTTSSYGAHPLIARYDSAGALDPTFGTNGLVVETTEPGTGQYRAVEIQGDGKIVVVGVTNRNLEYTFNGFLAARYSADGALDASFGGDGIVVTSTGPILSGDEWAADLAIQADGKIVAVGISHDASLNHFFQVVRYLGDDNLMAAAAAPAPSRAPSLKLPQVQALLTEAIARWQAAGFDTSGLGNVQVQIANLGGTTLGMASGNTILLDDNAAGWGWFVDRTPRNDSEFTTRGDQGERRHIDLLTVLEHELGHVLGFDHDEGGVMAETLVTGVRSMEDLGQLSVGPNKVERTPTRKR